MTINKSRFIPVDEKALRCVEGLILRQREWNQNEECFRLCPYPVTCPLKARHDAERQTAD